MKVTTISRGPHTEDVVRDDELTRAAEMQAYAWEAGFASQRLNSEIATRVMHGAKIVSDLWYWDADLKMVRSRKEKTG